MTIARCRAELFGSRLAAKILNVGDGCGVRQVASHGDAPLSINCLHPRISHATAGLSVILVTSS